MGGPCGVDMSRPRKLRILVVEESRSCLKEWQCFHFSYAIPNPVSTNLKSIQEGPARSQDGTTGLQWTLLPMIPTARVLGSFQRPRCALLSAKQLCLICRKMWSGWWVGMPCWIRGCSRHLVCCPCLEPNTGTTTGSWAKVQIQLGGNVYQGLTMPVAVPRRTFLGAELTRCINTEEIFSIFG